MTDRRDGTDPITEGWQPPRPTALIRAMGFTPNSLALSADMMTMALAPSFTPDEFPAVTFPVFGMKAEGSAARSAIVSPGRKCSSFAKMTGGFPLF